MCASHETSVRDGKHAAARDAWMSEETRVSWSETCVACRDLSGKAGAGHVFCKFEPPGLNF